MKKYLLCALGLVTGLFVLLAVARPAAKSGPPTQHFHLRGEIRGIDRETKSIRIKHEEIPNYMAAMTMPFSVRDPNLLRGLNIGEEIGFELIVTSDDSWIASIQKLSEPEENASGAFALLAAADAQALQKGETVPDFALIDQNGKTMRLPDFRGKAVLLTFIYTRCPLPNFCPLMSKNFASLQERLEKRFPGQFHLLSISIDPEFDQPGILKQYAARQTKNDSTWSFCTGTPDQIDTVGGLFGLIHERSGGLINHDLRTALIAPDGRLVHVWKSNAWTPYELERRVAELFGRSI